MNDTMIRQWALLRMLPRHPRRIDTASIHKQLAQHGIYVSLRTIQRDLNDLSRIFPLASDQSKPQGWWFEKGPSLEIPSMDPHAALTFNLVEQYMQHLLPPATLSHLSPWFETAQGIVKTEASIVSRWQDRLRVIPHTLNKVPARIDPEIQVTIYDALLHEKQLEVTYRAISTGQAAKTYPVHPLGLVVMEQVVYLVCTVKDYTDPRFLAIHRIDAATPLDAAAITPKGFDIDAFVSREFGIRVGSDPVQLRMRVRGVLGQYLAETPLAQGQRMTVLDAGWTRIEVEVKDTMQLRSWLRSLGRDAVVEGPATFREELREGIEELARLYQQF